MSAPAHGEARLVPCQGGPNRTGWLRVDEPLPLEVPCAGGTYVLTCDASPTGAGGHDGCREHWYVFVPEG